VNIATCGIKWSDASSVPIVTVIKPGIPEFFPKSGLPQVLQKIRVTVFPASLGREKVAGLPESSIPDSLNIAPVE
jgi:hypothetical protein